MIENEFKYCTRCGEPHRLENFPKRKRSKDGHADVCKHCYSAARKAKRTAKPKPLWKPRGWLGEFLGYSKLAECIIVSKPEGGVR